MLKILQLDRFAISLIACLTTFSLALITLQASAAEAAAKQDTAHSIHTKPKIDHSGRKQIGKASIYSSKFANKKMANGKRMDPNDDNAASKTLPLGTKAKVTNLETGQSTVVTIEDRGPYVKGRIVDLPPAKAKEIGITLKEGVAKVAVEPIVMPLADNSEKAGDKLTSED